MDSNKGKKPEAKNARERLDEKKKQKTLYTYAVAGLVVLALAAGFILLNGGQGSGNTAMYNQSQTDTSGQSVLIPLTDITDNAFHFYSLNSGGTAIKYFIVKDKSGTIHTAFDACDVCYAAKKGYRQSGDYARCNNCGKTFAVVDIGTRNTAGGCWPGYLPHEIQGDNIVLKNSDLGSGKYRFD